MITTTGDPPKSEKAEIKRVHYGTHYELVQDILGVGGQAKVFRALHTGSNKYVAIKVYTSELTSDPIALQTLQDKYNLIVEKLTHKNIVQYRDIGIDKQTQTYYIVMDYIDGHNLRKIIHDKPDHRFTLEETLAILEPMALALDYAHENHIVHRDVKPENIIIAQDKQVYLTDFDLATEIRMTLSRLTGNADNIQGTIPYMSPEQCKGHRINGQTDIWSLGVIFYEMIEGVHPFQGNNLKHYMELICNYEPETPEYLNPIQWQVLQTLLAKEKQERPVSAVQALQAIKESYITDYVTNISTDHSIDKHSTMKVINPEELFLLQQRIEYELQKIQDSKINREQTFGQHIDEIEINYTTGKDALERQSFSYAQEHFQKALQEIQWIKENSPLRRKIKQIYLPKLERQKKQADKIPVVQYYPQEYNHILEAIDTIKKNYDQGNFIETKKQSIEIKNQFKQLQIKALVQQLQDCIEQRKWKKVDKLIKIIFKIDPDNEETKTIQKTIAPLQAELYHLHELAIEQRDNQKWGKLIRTLERTLKYTPEDREIHKLYYHAQMQQQKNQRKFIKIWILFCILVVIFFCTRWSIHYLRYTKKAIYRAKNTSERLEYLGKKKYTCNNKTFTIAEFYDKGTGVEFALIPGGTFFLGSEQKENEKPVHEVEIQPFVISKHEITQQQWEDVMNYNPSSFIGANKPVHDVTWEDCKKFCKQAENYTLPSEAQWEYACRGGSSDDFCFGNNPKELNEYAVFAKEWKEENLAPIKTKKPNAYGLYDMHGNVWEWCLDEYEDNYNEKRTEQPYKVLSKNKKNISTNNKEKYEKREDIVNRGGSFSYDAFWCRSSYRIGDAPGYADRCLGFRVIYDWKEDYFRPYLDTVAKTK
ncbi:MAG: SUMF1/EgtB/PvdO family nonheme iron enzyme [Planctomycetes bacterium]|nr:SUMF1/EgtB/PvdO family nonheme iron enzyme [Planctomycetota bacterium]HPY74735.1 SUMF1/EgtB/PvdO family nonheme iron enzyme [Planctomycetota bacterium]HQA99742.1 SUMF1/EgtB/PvdO family nonheme iron enzyme [Planctomycetota bacterium]